MASVLTVQVQQLELDWLVGVLDFEKTTPQKLWISVDATVQAAILDSTECYTDVVCYADIVDFIKQYAQAGHVPLVETIANRICDYVLSNPAVQAVKVSVHKPNIIDECYAVGVVLQKQRDNRRL